MAYVALYRQWRPQDFDALVGQKAVKTTLKNALASGKIAHAYLFSVHAAPAKQAWRVFWPRL